MKVLNALPFLLGNISAIYMNVFILIIVFVLLFLSELVYFKIASRFNIVDQPNHRSSHYEMTIRGGGIIFILGLILYPFFYGWEYSCFLLGLAVIGFISFMDDIKPMSNRLRIIIHLFSVTLMFYQLELLQFPIYWIVLALFLVIGSINAINFMDGINGITGSYALTTLCSLLYINICVSHFVASNLIAFSIVSVAIFNFFNFRTKAKCFAGDVGSVGIAFVILFFLLQLMIKTGDFCYLLLLLLYGLDTSTTVFFRLIRRERVFDAHRSHFYQYWANERKTHHLVISASYALIQLLINILVILWLPHSSFLLFVTLFFSAIIFIIIRFSVEGSLKLLRH
jgi:UDP-GlcNAc:undecaprenyl-phosphate GlcNAc-1-phosphate transferase